MCDDKRSLSVGQWKSMRIHIKLLGSMKVNVNKRIQWLLLLDFSTKVKNKKWENRFIWRMEEVNESQSKEK